MIYYGQVHQKNNKLPHGQGFLIDKKLKKMFEGNFKNGKLDGQARYVTNIREVTEGTFKNNSLNGEGYQLQSD